MRPRGLPIALALVLANASAGDELQTAEEIDACYRANYPENSSIQTISMNSVDRIGAITTSRATMYWKKFDDGLSKVLMKFTKPAEMRGAGLLMLEKEKRNDKRVTKHMTSASMFGTDFSYEEFERLQGIATKAPVTRMEDAAVGERPSYVIEVRPEEEDSAYERIRTWIDKETCVALRAEFYEHGDKPRKIMTANPSKVTREGGIWMPREILMQDRRDETETTMLVEEVEVGAKVHRKMFSQKELEQAGS
jgi:outer membrane lipoprotein-sorting protein